MPDTIDKATGEIFDGTIEITSGGKSSGPIKASQFQASVEKAMEAFALEPPEPGKVPDRVIDELRRARTVAKDHAQAFSDCIKAQAEKYSVKPGALKRYIVALCDDKVEEVENETDDLQRLIGAGE